MPPKPPRGSAEGRAQPGNSAVSRGHGAAAAVAAEGHRDGDAGVGAGGAAPQHPPLVAHPKIGTG